MSNTASFSHDDMVRKVAALLETAESFAVQGNDEAAQAYVEKAHALQQKYSIDLAMIDAKNGTKTEKIISKHILMHGKWGKRKVHLAHVIAHATHCTGYFSTSYGKKMGPGLVEVTDYNSPKVYYYTVFGFESDVDHVEYLIHSLNRQMDVALAHASKQFHWEHGKTYNASFCMGFATTISQRLREASRKAQQSAQAEATGSTSVSLVLVAKKDQVEAEMRAKVGRLGKGSKSTANSGSGYSAGREAGSRATIARGSVGSSSRGSLNR